ncbi:MAG: hypothetical protein U0401_04865 [Anaerolineae bacterium]
MSAGWPTTSLPEASYWDTQQGLAYAHRRRGFGRSGGGLAAGGGGPQVYAHVELAKYYEHQQRDYPQAVQWTWAAIELVYLVPIFRAMNAANGWPICSIAWGGCSAS